MRKCPVQRWSVQRWSVVLPMIFLVGLLGAVPGWGEQTIPDHPSRLRFEALDVSVPDASKIRHQLSNGVVVYIAQDSSLPLVDIAVAVRAGDYLDPQDRVGLAGLTAALMRRGGSGEFTAEEFDRRVDRLGAQIGSSAGGTRAGAQLNCTTWVLEEALDLFAGMLRSPRFQADRLQQAKTNLGESLRHRRDEPLRILDQEWNWLLFGRDHYSARPLLPSTLSSIQPADLKSFHRRYWQPANMVVAVSGDVDVQQTLAALEKTLGSWEKGEAASWPPPAPVAKLKPALYHLEHPTPQAKIALGHRGAVRKDWSDPSTFTLAVMNEVLGGSGSVSRLLSRLRQVEGLVYRAGSRFQVNDHWPGDFQIFLETQASAAGPAIAGAVEEIERLRSRPPSDLEIDLARRNLGDVFPLLFDSAEKTAGYFAEDEYLGRPHSFWNNYRGNIRAVSSRDVQRAATAHLKPDQLVIVVVGPWKEIKSGAGKLLNGFEVVHLPDRDPLTLAPRPGSEGEE